MVRERGEAVKWLSAGLLGMFWLIIVLSFALLLWVLQAAIKLLVGG